MSSYDDALRRLKDRQPLSGEQIAEMKEKAMVACSELSADLTGMYMDEDDVHTLVSLKFEVKGYHDVSVEKGRPQKIDIRLATATVGASDTAFNLTVVYVAGRTVVYFSKVPKDRTPRGEHAV